ncbi:MAG TPA: hypothetical protein VGF87_02220, partial [Acidimicrobiales bacterium]
MRRRLMLALIGLVAFVLVIAGAGSLVLTRNSARQQATSQIVTEAQSLSSSKAAGQSVPVLKVIRRVLKLEDALFVRITVGGIVTTALPSDLSVAELQPQKLIAGQTVSGRSGNLVFAAAPIDLSPRERLKLRVYGTLAIVLTRQVGDLGPSWSYFLLAGGG